MTPVAVQLRPILLDLVAGLCGHPCASKHHREIPAPSGIASPQAHFPPAFPKRLVFSLRNRGNYILGGAAVPPKVIVSPVSGSLSGVVGSQRKT